MRTPDHARNTEPSDEDLINAADSGARPPLRGVLETVLYARGLFGMRDQIRAFYEDTLGLSLISGDGSLALGFRVTPGSVLLIFDPGVSGAPGRDVPSHGAVGPGHFAMRIDAEDADAWVAYLESRGVAIEKLIDWPDERRPEPAEETNNEKVEGDPFPKRMLGPGRSIYVRDPAGNSVELITADIWPAGSPPTEVQLPT